MRRISFLALLLLLILAPALPALAQEEGPLANSLLFTGGTAWALIGLAVLLVLLFILWARRGPN